MHREVTTGNACPCTDVATHTVQLFTQYFDIMVLWTSFLFYDKTYSLHLWGYMKDSVLLLCAGKLFCLLILFFKGPLAHKLAHLPHRQCPSPRMIVINSSVLSSQILEKWTFRTAGAIQTFIPLIATQELNTFCLQQNAITAHLADNRWGHTGKKLGRLSLSRDPSQCLNSFGPNCLLPMTTWLPLAAEFARFKVVAWKPPVRLSW